MTSSGSGKVKESEVEGLTEQSVEPMEVGKNENTGKTPKMPETPQTPETPAPSGNVPDKVGAGLPTETPVSVATTVSAPSGVPAAGPGPWTLTRHVVFSKSFFINIYVIAYIFFFVPASKQLCTFGTLVNMANSTK